MGEGVAGVTGVRSPTVRRRELGTLLRTLRTEAGLTVDQVADHLMCSSSKVSRIETGQRGASPRDIRDLCDLYGVRGQVQRDHLTALGREGKRQAWWQPYDLPYAAYVGLEADAVSISDYESGVVPGLFQTPAYARALHEGALPRLSSEVIDQRIEERRTRQEALVRDDPPQLTAIMDEAVLRRPVGGAAVMRAQLQRVIEESGKSNVNIQIIPFEVGAHPALDSTFALLEFLPPIPAVVYVEGLVGQMYLERAQDVQRYERVFERLCAIALGQEESAEFIQEAADWYKGA